MAYLRSSCCLGLATATLLASACSFQDFDYLKDSYHPANGGGGAGQTTAGSTSSGGSDSEAGDTSGGNSSAGAGKGGAISQGGMPPGGDAGEGGAPPEPPGMLINPSFELGSGTTITGWTSEGTVGAATVVFQEARTGSGRLGHWLELSAYKVSTWQVVKPLVDGKYTFEIWVKRSQYLTDEYIFARDYSLAEPAAEKIVKTAVGDPNAQEAGYVKVSILHIPVTSGKIKVGIYSEETVAGSKDNWSVIDDAALTLEP